MNDKMNIFGWCTRREFIHRIASGAMALSSTSLLNTCKMKEGQASTFIGEADDYQADLSKVIVAGMRELGVTREEIIGKRILLKPNLVEVHSNRPHINTHPLLVRGAIEAFLHLGAGKVLVGEGPGHSRDTLRLVDESGLLHVLSEDRVSFVDLNYQDFFPLKNQGRFSNLKDLYFPATLQQVDWVVSMPKLKTHHWAGITVSMKNLFGLMPGLCYGWPKNVLHYAGIDKAILDINATVHPSFAIVDGIVGMEGDGPIMGKPKLVGVIVMGRNLTAVDATCARIMGVNPTKVGYLNKASGHLGPIRELNIPQRGERVSSVRTKFELLDYIPAHQGLR